MKQWQKRALALGCALTLAAGSAAASSVLTTRTLEAQYMGIKLMVSGREVTPTDANGKAVEPFAVDGTVYLPVRAVGEALGKDVAWDGTTNTVTVGHAPLDEDARQLVATLEATHPAFALDQVPAGYEEAKTAFLAAAADPACTVYDFTWAAMACTASLGDEHTRIDPFGGTPQASLDVGWAADGERLLLTGEDGAVTAAQVTAVGGVPTADLFALIDRYVASENQAGRDWNHAQWAALKPMLLKAGAVIDGENAVELTLLENGATTRKTVGLSMPVAPAEVPTASTEELGGVFYVDFNQCVDDEVFQAARGALEQAVKAGTSKVVIDVRGNGGGNSDTCVQLLNAMGMRAPNYGGYVRYSPLAMATYPNTYEQDSGGDRAAPHPETAKANPNVDLVVLTDEGTFSSASMLAVYVRDGGLGTIIGRPSANMPNHYGDILYFQLENTGAYVTVSHKQWLRPDQSAQGNELTPDVVTAVGEDALETALAYLAQR